MKNYAPSLSSSSSASSGEHDNGGGGDDGGGDDGDGDDDLLRYCGYAGHSPPANLDGVVPPPAVRRETDIALTMQVKPTISSPVKQHASNSVAISQYPMFSHTVVSGNLRWNHFHPLEDTIVTTKVAREDVTALVDITWDDTTWGKLTHIQWGGASKATFFKRYYHRDTPGMPPHFFRGWGGQPVGGLVNLQEYWLVGEVVVAVNIPTVCFGGVNVMPPIMVVTEKGAPPHTLLALKKTSLSA